MTQATAGAATALELRVGGITPFTSIDFPGKLAAVVFVQGCPWKCSYCHNPHLQPRDVDSRSPPTRWPDVVGWLRRRVGLIDAVVFSGGEPTIDPRLADAIGDVRALGLGVALHTAGIYPRRLRSVLPLLDWVGVDVKAPLDGSDLYDGITGIAGSRQPVREAVRAVLDSGVAHEFRTTAHPDFLAEPDLLRLAEGLAREGATNFALQIARPVAGSPCPLAAIGAYPSSAAMARLEQLFPDLIVRAA